MDKAQLEHLLGEELEDEYWQWVSDVMSQHEPSAWHDEQYQHELRAEWCDNPTNEWQVKV